MSENQKTAAADRKPFEAWALELGVEASTLAGAKALRAWPAGREVTRAEFERAVAAFLDTPLR